MRFISNIQEILSPKHQYQTRTDVFHVNLISLSFRDLLVGTELEAVIVHIPEGDTFQAEQQTCQLLGDILHFSSRFVIMPPLLTV